MGTENYAGPFGHLAQLFYEYCARLPQLIHNMAVVHDLFAYVNRCAIKIQDDLDYIDGTDNPCAKAARTEEYDLLAVNAWRGLEHDR